MEWNLKATSWDLTEFDQPIDGGSSNNFGFDLKLGQVNYDDSSSSMNMNMNMKWKDLGGVKMESASGSTTSKRARANTLTVNCLVDGCNSDLSNCKDYHRRHKVCELHSKTPEVTVAGQKQRFCQQCSRFHSLEEFDKGKRSCRKRLDGHNRRRRKAQPDPLARPPNFLSGYQGSQCLPFASSLVYPSATLASHTWAAGASNIKADATRVHQHQQLHQNLFLNPSSSSCSNGSEKQFSFFNNIQMSSDQAPICQSLLPSSGYFDRLTSDQVPAAGSSDCALSLLSNSISNPLAQSLHINPSARKAPQHHVHCPAGMFEMTGPDANEPSHHPLPFNWECRGFCMEMR